MNRKYILITKMFVEAINVAIIKLFDAILFFPLQQDQSLKQVISDNRFPSNYFYSKKIKSSS
jgi:hypothetical protein